MILKILLILLSFSSIACASTLQVASDSTGDYLTIAEANAVAVAGDRIEIKCGLTYREKIDPVSGSASAGYTTYTSYGTGALPLILGSIDLSSSANWTDEGGNLWYATCTTQAGNLIFNSEALVGVKCALKTDLDTQGEFWWDDTNDRVYLFSTSDPGTFYTKIECALKPSSDGILNSKSYLIFENLDFRYSGVGTLYGTSTSNITIRDCHFSYNGGAYQTGTTRYGGGIGTGNSASDWLIERCIIENEFDDVLTIQAWSNTTTISNITFKNNIGINCGLYGFEYFNSGTGGTVSNVNIINNTFYNIPGGWSWGYPVRGYPAGLGLYNNHATISGFNIKNNIFYSLGNLTETGASYKQRCLFVGGAYFDNLADIDIDNNLYFENDNTREMIYYQGATYNQSQFSTYQSATGQDAHSISADPFLTDTYRLRTGSPCINAGVDLGIEEDYFGNKRTGTPDIGAYEWGVHFNNGTIRNMN